MLVWFGKFSAAGALNSKYLKFADAPPNAPKYKLNSVEYFILSILNVRSIEMLNWRILTKCIEFFRYF